MFRGLKIIDFTRVFSGPYCTQYFASYGANIIKVEHSTGDESRNFPPMRNQASGYFEILNHNKDSITINLLDTNDYNIILDLIKGADIVIENYSPDIKFKLKIDYETIKKINPKIIYASISGYGQNIDKKAYDVIIQAESGLMSLNGEDKPMKNATSIVDAFSGVNCAFAISSALYKRELTGYGEYIDVSMLGSALHLLENNLIQTSIDGKNPELVGNHDSAISPFGLFKTKDSNIALAIGNNTLWNIFGEKFGINDATLFGDNHLRLKNHRKLIDTIEEKFSTYGVQELIVILRDIGIPCSKVNTMNDLLENKLLFEGGYLKKIIHPELGECVIPFETIKFRSVKMTDYKFAPKLGYNNTDYKGKNI